MPCDHDEGAFFDLHRHRRGFRRTEVRRIARIKHFHRGEVVLTDFENDGKKFVHTEFFTYRDKRSNEERRESSIFTAQNFGVVSICGRTANTEKDERLQGTDVFISRS